MYEAYIVNISVIGVAVNSRNGTLEIMCQLLYCL